MVFPTDVEAIMYSLTVLMAGGLIGAAIGFHEREKDSGDVEIIKLVRESDVIDRTDGSELAKAFNYLFAKYIDDVEECEKEESSEYRKGYLDGYKAGKDGKKLDFKRGTGEFAK